MTENIGIRLRLVRMALKVKVYDIASLIGYSTKFIWEVERDIKKPGIVFVSKICQEYDISIDSLVYDTDAQFDELLNDLKGVKI